MSDDIAVTARALRKTYGSLVAVDGIDFDVPRGSCFGFLGPNGAGKTTTMRMTYCASPVTGGELSVLGVDATSRENHRGIKRRIGVVPQEDNLDQELSLAQNLAVFARFYRLGRAEARRRTAALLEQVGLAERADAQVLALSGGMKRRALIARGLVGDPELLVLDEPTTGLDPQARHLLWALVAELKQRSVTVLLTTHYMDEAERLCDQLVVMDQGRVVDRGTPADLVATHCPGVVVEVWVPPGETPAQLEALQASARESERLSDRVLLHTDDGEAMVTRVAQALPGHRSLLRPANLEDVFLRLTGRALS